MSAPAPRRQAPPRLALRELASKSSELAPALEVQVDLLQALEVGPEPRRFPLEARNLRFPQVELAVARLQLHLAGGESREGGAPRARIRVPVSRRIVHEQSLERELGEPVVAEARGGVRVQPGELEEGASVRGVTLGLRGHEDVEIACLLRLAAPEQVVRLVHDGDRRRRGMARLWCG